jgi:hypothetical protein
MRWSEVQEFAKSHGLEIYKPYCGHHRLAQITTADGQPVSWTANRAKDAHIAIAAIVHQRQLDRLTDTEAIALAKESII